MMGGGLLFLKIKKQFFEITVREIYVNAAKNW